MCMCGGGNNALLLFFWFAVALCLNKGFFVPDMHEMLLECLCTVKEKC